MMRASLRKNELIKKGERLTKSKSRHESFRLFVLPLAIGDTLGIHENMNAVIIAHALININMLCDTTVTRVEENNTRTANL